MQDLIFFKRVKISSFLAIFLLFSLFIGKDTITLAAVSPQKGICLKSSLALKVESRFVGSKVALMRVNFSPDGKSILTASGEGEGDLWSLKGKSLAQFHGQKPPMFNANFSPDGKTVITTGYDGTIRLWRTNGDLIEQRFPHQAAVADARFSPDGNQIVTSSDDGQTKIFSKDGKQLASIIKPGTARNLAYNQQGTLIASVSDSGILHLIHPSGKLQKDISTGQGRINSVTFSPNGSEILTASIDGTVKIWNLQGKLITNFKASTVGWVNSAKFDPKANIVATASDDGTLRLWQPNGKLLKSISLGSEKLTSLSFSPEGNEIAVVSNKGNVWIVSLCK